MAIWLQGPPAELSGRALPLSGARRLQVTGLLHHESRVEGVTYVTAEGREERLQGDAVVLATGGFGANRELLKKYAPEVRVACASGGLVRWVGGSWLFPC